MLADEPRMNKVERLAVAGAVAPSLREGAESSSRRRVARVDAEGNVVGYTTLAEVQKAILARHQIELSVQPDSRPTHAVCARDGRLFRVPKKGNTPKYCEKCREAKCRLCGKDIASGAARKRCREGLPPGTCFACRKSRLVCVDCSSELPKGSGAPSRVAARAGQPPRCRRCSYKLFVGRSRADRKPPPICHCGATLSRSVLLPSKAAARGGAAPRCKSCVAKARKR